MNPAVIVALSSFFAVVIVALAGLPVAVYEKKLGHNNCEQPSKGCYERLLLLKKTNNNNIEMVDDSMICSTLHTFFAVYCGCDCCCCC